MQPMWEISENLAKSSGWLVDHHSVDDELPFGAVPWYAPFLGKTLWCNFRGYRRQVDVDWSWLPSHGDLLNTNLWWFKKNMGYPQWTIGLNTTMVERLGWWGVSRTVSPCVSFRSRQVWTSAAFWATVTRSGWSWHVACPAPGIRWLTHHMLFFRDMRSRGWQHHDFGSWIRHRQIHIR